MRIVLAHKYFYRGGGTATYLFALMEELQKRGHKCIPFTVAYDQTVPREYWDYYVSPPAASDVTHLKDMQLSPWGKLRLLGRAAWSLEAYRKALRLVADLKPDIAYVHNLYSYMSPSPISAFKKRGVPVVMRVADYNMVCPGLQVLRDGQPCTECIERGPGHALRYRCHKGSLPATAARVATLYAHRLLRVYAGVDLFLTPSRFLGDVLVEAGLPASRVKHLPSFYPAVPQASDAARGDYMLYFGRVSPEKGLDVLLRAMALLETRVPLLIAGADVDGETARLQALATELGLSQIRFLGMQQRAALDGLIEGALFTVVPSRWYDNCPMSVLESFAHGKAVVGANIGGIPEQIVEGCGLLFAPGDAADLAQKLQTLLADAAAREQMGRAATQRLQDVYSPARHCNALMAEFGRLIGAD